MQKTIKFYPEFAEPILKKIKTTTIRKSTSLFAGDCVQIVTENGDFIANAIITEVIEFCSNSGPLFDIYKSEGFVSNEAMWSFLIGVYDIKKGDIFSGVIIKWKLI